MSCCAGLNPVNDLRYYNSCVLQSLPLYSFTFIPFCLSVVIILLYDFSKFPVTLCPHKAFWEGFCQAGLLGCTDFVPQILLKKTPWPVYKLFAVITGSSHILALLAWGATIYNTQIISKIMDWKVICQVVVTFLSLSQTESFVACMKLGVGYDQITALTIVRQDVSNLLFTKQVLGAELVFLEDVPHPLSIFFIFLIAFHQNTFLVLLTLVLDLRTVRFLA